MSEAFSVLYALALGFGIGWLAAWVFIRTPPPAKVTVDWDSIKTGIVTDGKVVVYNQVDWSLLQVVAENSGYELTRKGVH